MKSTLPISITCVSCHNPFDIDQEEADFFARIAPIFNGKTSPVAFPQRCPRCRLRRRLAHRNQIYVFYRKLSGHAKPRFTCYFEGAPFPIIPNDQWWSEEGWSPEDFGRPFDFSRPFFEQFAELRALVPRPAINSVMNENSEYCNNTGDLKNCYFVFDGNTVEDSMYLETCHRVKQSLDCSDINSCELCYDCAGIFGCYNLQSSNHCHECSDSYYLLNCRSCSNCFGCANLVRRSYCVFNEQKTRDEYAAIIQSLPLESWHGREQIKQSVAQIWNHVPRPHLYGSRCEEVTGNHITNARAITESFFISEAERMRYCFACSQGANDCQDLTIWGQHAELLYECLICGNNTFHLLFCYNCWNGSSELLYCDTCHGSTHLFGCVGMNKRSYCILNRKYSKEEYFTLLPRILQHLRTTGEWGEFFPSQLSHTPYNYSVAQRYFPRTRQEIAHEGLWWYDPPADPNDRGAISASALPDTLPDESAPIVASSAMSGKPFRITTKEIEFYRGHRIPLPRHTYDERMNERKARLGGVLLSPVTCARSGVTLLTAHAPDSPYKIIEKELFDKELTG